MNMPVSPSGALSHAPRPAAVSLMEAARSLLHLLETGKSISTVMLRHAVESAYGDTDANGAWVWKDAYEALECAQILFMLKYGPRIRRQAADPAAELAMIERISALVPTQTRRSEESQRLQQFSTPLPLAFVAAHAGGICADDTLLEPSAGTGMMACYARIAGADLLLNELAADRAQLLGDLFGTTVTRHDAATIHDRLDAALLPSIVLMNPPFSVAPNVEGRFRAATMQHVRSALARLAPGGRLVMISGSNFAPGSSQSGDFFRSIEDRAAIRFSSAISGRVYASHGTSFETRLTVIDKETGSVTAPALHAQAAASCAELLARVIVGVPARNRVTSPAISLNTAKPAHSIMALRDKARAQARADAAEATRHPLDKADFAEIDYEPRTENAETSAQPASLYEPYRVQAINIIGAFAHPTALVQSAAMASIAPPLPSYRPTLPNSLISTGALSDAQIESVIYAGEAHNGHLSGTYTVNDTYDQLTAAPEDAEKSFRLRRGWYLGDGTGCGKGRQVAGVIMDNFLKGRRRAVWVSKSETLLSDSVRDWTALGGAASDVVPLARFRQGAPIKLEQGILFVTYATLRTAERQDGDGKLKASRLQQLIDWLGQDFDGVIAFDEAHAMANAAGDKGERGEKKPSEQGLAGLRLQNAVPDARILYVSATGATTVANLAYASRLGLWATGDFPFASRADFVGAMESGGIAAMEVISRDLKALGLYMARSISFQGVEYEMLVHELTDAQRAIYDEYAVGYQVIHANLEQALLASGITSEEGTLNGQAKSAARSCFESTKQRFFSHLITAMKCPSLIKAIEGDIAAGHSAVIQIVSTSEALLDRRLAEIPASEWNDLSCDTSPREYIVSYLQHAFPTQLFEPYTDEDGNLRSRPARDAAGNPIQCREALERRDRMIEHLCALPPVHGALDQVLWHFGKDRVAEVTGRSRRIVRTSDGRLCVERRPGSSNLSDAHAYMNDDKRVLIFSDAGGTGRSYHADLTVKNQRLRVHYLLEPGWRADNAIQGLGRTHRTNQAQPPLFRPCATNVKGEKRFLSTIARRLDTLGAITKGQRQTGGQGMFRPEDNLESPYARVALRQFFSNLVRGKVDACSLTQFVDMTGLNITDSAGSLLDQLPPISQFLNRCLALTIDMQNAIFETFEMLLEKIVDDALRAGTLDIGLETLTAERFDVIERRIIHEHAASGARTLALTIDETTRNKPLSLEMVCQIAASDRSASLLVNAKSGRAALMQSAPSVMDEDGAPVRRVQLTRPMHREKLFEAELGLTHWKAATDAEFEQAWSDEVSQVPEFSTRRLTLISGLLLPIWNKLPSDNCRVYRLETNDGERVLGRLVTTDQLSTVYRALGIDAAVDMTAAEMLEAVMERGASVDVSGGLTLKRSRVMGEPRLEIVGHSASDLPALKALGCFTEIISWSTRLFVPANNLDVLDRLLERHRMIAHSEAA
ncbi:strawberry notch-like NTP hydrolase domain-containing protein [Mesorhizobium sp. M1B.F.Ca.ET.045.04.1.1]|uniref:strawberry notch-like NTP hydrolase domain-containing protein n=1 Tax=Mesorhizobium sp. M1B.F.Ca.ET.045.04.1.1 TaxID=2493673 RepID=UPI001AECF07D|nr:strawberry notch family protein [Mesorhizobium sp. M1B.F.Ca.ET.045.04.1.1]